MLALLLDITIIFGLAIAAALLSHKLRFPLSIGLLSAGVLAGPDALGLVRNVHQVELLAEIGVVMLLFVIGLEFSIADLSHMRRQFLVGGSLQFFGTAAVVGSVTLLMGSTMEQSLYLGFVVALSSTAIVLRLLQERAELDSPHGRSVLATLIYQDIAVVPLMLTAPLLAGVSGDGGQAGAVAVGSLLLRVAGVGAFAFVAYRWAVPWLLARVTATRSPEAFLLTVFALCIGIALLTQAVGLSLALGAFLAGLIISESDYSHQAVTVVLPFRDVFMSLFFVSIGMLLDIQFLMSDPVRLILLTAGVVVVKPLVAGFAGLVLGLPVRSAVLAGVALGQVGEFSLVATQAGVAAGLFGTDVFQTVLDTVVMSMLFTPVLMALGPRLADAVAASPLALLERRGFPSTRVGSAHEYQGHVLIIGFGVTGRNVARTARAVDVPYAVVELNAAAAKEAAEQGEPVHYGDATQETILRHVDADKARAIAVVIDDPPGTRRIVELARRIAPDAFIVVRSRYLREVEPLLALGADEVIADELEVSIEVFSRVLARMLVPRDEIKGLIGMVRGDWRRMARTFDRSATSVHDLQVHVPEFATYTLRIEPTSPLAGVSIADSRLRTDHDVTVLSVIRGGSAIGNPRGDTIISADDVLFVIGPIEWDPAAVR